MDLITFEYKIISKKVKKNQTCKKERKDFPYHRVLQDFYPATAKV
jgi:hypothetical protein